MCACRHKKTSFLIEDILKDTKRTHKDINVVPKEPHSCNVRRHSNVDAIETRFNIATEAHREYDLKKIKFNLDERRNTYPLHPTPLKANMPWHHYKVKGNNSYGLDMRNTFSFCSDLALNKDHLLRNQLTADHFSRPLNMRQAQGADRGLPLTCCSPWWGLGGRRKGGQVRFSVAQTGALERRFGASKYLSPDERRSLAASLHLSDRQVKTWFQNRRAKWRRTAPDCTESASPQMSDDLSDDEPTETDNTRTA